MVTFSYLVSISPKIKQRYKEVEKMVMYSSPSFYDALGNLLESYMKNIANNYNISPEFGSSHGKISNALQPFLINQVNMRETTYYEMKKLSGNVNYHKHENLKFLSLDMCISSLRVFFDFYSQISQYSLPSFREYFDKEYYSNIYGILSPNNIINLVSLLKGKKDSMYEEIEQLNNKQSKLSLIVNLLNQSNQ